MVGASRSVSVVVREVPLEQISRGGMLFGASRLASVPTPDTDKRGLLT
jgi:hypothetical protein